VVTINCFQILAGCEHEEREVELIFIHKMSRQWPDDELLHLLKSLLDSYTCSRCKIQEGVVRRIISD